MLVVDTNIIAPLYIRSAYTDGVHQLRRRDGVWRTDPFAIIELSNVLATYQPVRYLTAIEAQRCLAQADRFLRPHYVEVPHDAALEFAIRHGVTTYDARFLALAERLGLPLITEDGKPRAAAPTLTQSLAEALVAA
jgi:predicted nucleic acid-binding protein